MPHPAGLDFLVNKDDWKQHRVDDAPVPDPADGQVLFRVDPTRSGRRVPVPTAIGLFWHSICQYWEPQAEPRRQRGQ